MLKKIYAFTIAIACIIPALHGQDVEKWFEIKPGYFFFSNHLMRKIYHGGFEIQGSGTYPMCQSMLAFYWSLGYLHVKGKSLGAHQKTSVSQVPIDLGVRAIFDMRECAKAYLTIGPRYFYFHQRNDSMFVDRNVRRSGFGFFINGGSNFIQNDCFMFGIFGEYGFQQKSFTTTMPNVYGRKDFQVGGFTFGASIGFMF